DTRHILVRAKVNGKGPFQFIVDTGAPEIYLSHEVAKQLGWKENWNNNKTASLELEGGLTTALLPIREDDPAPLVGMNSTGLAGFKLDGILGYTALSRYKIEIDFTKNYLVWTEQKLAPTPPSSMKKILNGKPMPSMKGVESLNDFAKSAGSMMQKGTFNPRLRGTYGFLLEEKTQSVHVTGVLTESAASRSNFAGGDRIVSVTVGEREPREIHSLADLSAALELSTANEEVQIEIIRNGKTMTLALGQPGRDF
ncbi:MAG: aspartyl protease family protein, partial [Chthonomonadales bacterium]